MVRVAGESIGAMFILLLKQGPDPGRSSLQGSGTRAR